MSHSACTIPKHPFLRDLRRSRRVESPETEVANESEVESTPESRFTLLECSLALQTEIQAHNTTKDELEKAKGHRQQAEEKVEEICADLLGWYNAWQECKADLDRYMEEYDCLCKQNIGLQDQIASLSSRVMSQVGQTPYLVAAFY
ncbi:hypothetical protein M501DRAFT_999377 [Patellaria atrata CBS 101060]|uniref:Uncharacterized protein n=1 Tax=Patellaria atrata CBS 101060 TaxID=1346257 RepID=A0A9P4VML8_9PEZI|nr:hypothetical protein M501DRAFT_999377 [Patellaria atrata CBS 101060]